VSEASSPLSEVGLVLERAGVRYAIIGAHAVNVWLEPRATADIDVTVETSVDRHLHDVLASAGYRVAAEVGAGAPSGPDFVRYVSNDGSVTVELQVAKTALQRQVVARARRAESGVLVATPEDLIVLKLIAWRRKDELDLLGLVGIGELDWGYVERWASEWNVTDRLEDVRGRVGSEASSAGSTRAVDPTAKG